VSAPEPYIIFLVGLGLVVLLIAWFPMAFRQLPLSLPIICVGIGWAVFSLDFLRFDPDPRTYDTVTERLTELVVIVSLMDAGLKIDRRVTFKGWGSTWRLLAVTMPLSIVGVAALGFYGLGLGLAAAALLGAALAPTDPVLASDVQVGPPRTGEEDEVRFALTSEAGLNDGLAFPFVHLAIALTAMATMNNAEAMRDWLLVDVLWRLAAGVAVGWLVGRLLGWLTFRSQVRLSGNGDGLVALSFTLIAYGVAELLQGYGFMAVFVTAVTMRSYEYDHEFHDQMHEFAEQIERLLMMLVLVLFGGAIAGGLFAPLTWSDLGVAMAVLFIVRPLAGWIGLIGSKHPLRDRALIAFLGIRGIGSFYYLAYAINHGDFGDTERLWAVTGLIVLCSILIHGVTSTPLMRLIDGPHGSDRRAEGEGKVGGGPEPASAPAAAEQREAEHQRQGQKPDPAVAHDP